MFVPGRIVGGRDACYMIGCACRPRAGVRLDELGALWAHCLWVCGCTSIATCGSGDGPGPTGTAGKTVPCAPDALQVYSVAITGSWIAGSGVVEMSCLPCVAAVAHATWLQAGGDSSGRCSRTATRKLGGGRRTCEFSRSTVDSAGTRQPAAAARRSQARCRARRCTPVS